MKNRVAIVVDVSGSMGSIKQQTIKMVNNTITNLKNEYKKWQQETSIDLITFDNYVQTIYKDIDVRFAQNFSTSNFRLGHSTKLFDAIGLTINDLINDENEDDYTSFVLLVITDGYENGSKTFRNVKKLTQLIKSAQLSDRFTITLQVPRGDKLNLIRLGIPEENIREWDQTTKGVDEVETSITRGLSNYYQSRATGQRSIKNFYVQPDLSSVKTRDLQKLENQSLDYDILTVNKECAIKPFVESKTGIRYSPGVALYQLSKPEVIQCNKNVALMDRRDGSIYSGFKARNLIGLPTNASAKVIPGNHGNYEIFVQSNSVNRKLVRGTKVLVRK